MSSKVPFLYPLSEDGSPGEPWELDRPSLMVGRGESSDITVFDDALSRGHFLIVREAGEFFVVDLDSQNGTKVDDRPVTGCKLKSGQIISAGTSRFQFSTELLPVPNLPNPVALTVTPRVLTAPALPG